MKNCPFCNAQIDDQAAFCPVCGKNATAPAPAPEVVQNPVPAAFQNPAPVYQGDSPTAALIRKYCSSTLFLIVAIAVTAVILFNVISAMSFNEASQGFISTISRKLDLPSNITDPLENAGSSSVFSLLFGQITEILIAVGLWITYLSAKMGRGKMNTAGLTIIKVISIIYIVFMSIGALVLAITSAVLPSLLGEIGSDKIANVLRSILLAVLIGGLVTVVFGIIYQALVLKTVNSVKNTIDMGQSKRNVSAVLAVFCIIAGVCTIISAISTGLIGEIDSHAVKRIVRDITNADTAKAFVKDDFVKDVIEIINRFVRDMNTAIILSKISSVISGAASFIVGVLIFKFRKERKRSGV